LTVLFERYPARVLFEHQLFWGFHCFPQSLQRM
jgi:hypothetical protein